MQFDYHDIFGPDVSFYQGNPQKLQFIDFNKMRDWRNEDDIGISFVIIKSSQYNYADPAFSYNRVAARNAGLRRAFYHFLDHRGDGKSQARFYWNLIKDDPGEGPLIVDFEAGSGNWERLWDFLVELQRLSSYPANKIWVYTGFFYWQDHGPLQLEQELAFAIYRLWIAAYGTTADKVRVPNPPWLTSILWQKGTTVVWGPDLGVVSLELDWNEFNGDRELFDSYWKNPYTPDPDEEEEINMVQYEVVWGNGVSRRVAPSTNATTVGTYSLSAKVNVIQEGIPDSNDPNNILKVWVKFEDGYFGAAEYPNSAGVPSVRMVKIIPLPEPEPGNRAFRFKADGFKEVTGELIPE